MLVLALGVGALVRNMLATKTVHLQVRPTPANATVRIDNETCASGDCSFDLKPGEYSIQVSAEGYETKTTQATLALSNANPTLTIAIAPLPPAIQVTANFAQGQVSLDGATRGRLQEGQFVVDGLRREGINSGFPEVTGGRSFHLKANLLSFQCWAIFPPMVWMPSPWAASAIRPAFPVPDVPEQLP